MPTYIGTNKIKGAYVGTNKVKSIYVGTNKVYSSSNIPQGYEALKYLEASGHQYIITDIIATVPLSFNFEIIARPGNTKSNRTLISNAGLQAINYDLLTLGFIRMYYGTGGYQNYGISTNVNAFHSIKKNGGKFYFDGEQIADYGETSPQPYTNYTAVSFFFMHDRWVDQWYSNDSVERFDYNNNGFKSSIIPLLRISDSKPGMYDVATQTFYTNQGSGEFGYEKLDGTYVQPI